MCPAFRSYFSLFILLSFLQGCVSGSAEREIQDLRTFPQSASFYLDPDSAEHPLISEPDQRAHVELFRKKFFSPWHENNLEKSETLFWAVDWLDTAEVYGANLHRHPRAWIDALLGRVDREGYPSRDLAAISVATTDLRALPSAQPCFLDPAKAGEGFPFDYLQNSLLVAGTPVRITHQTRDGSWLLVETALVSGWVRPAAIAQVDEHFIADYGTGPLLALTRDRLPVIDSDGRFRFVGKIGSLFPLSEAQPEGYVVRLPVADAQGNAILQTAMITKNSAALFPLQITAKRIAELADHLLGQTYGWGGSFGYRDCSSTLRDLFSPFGLWLPRNSSSQAKAGQVISLAGLALLDKKQLVVAQAKPYLTLIWQKGHIMLYLGEYQQQGVVLHTMWGLRTNDLRLGLGRKVVGKTVITSLQPGKELLNLATPKGNLLYRIEGMTLLGAQEGGVRTE